LISWPVATVLSLLLSGAAPDMGLSNAVSPWVSPLLPSEDGFCILEAELTDPTGRAPSRKCRFLLDTGSEVIAIDSAVPSAYFWTDEGFLDLKDVNGQAFAGQAILIKQLSVGPLSSRTLPAIRMELRHGPGSLQDEPVDGILGMPFLAGKRFILDVPNRRILWWGPAPERAMRLPFADVPSSVPHVPLKAMGVDMPALVDTGCMGGFHLPPEACPGGVPGLGGSVGMAGGVGLNRMGMLDHAYLGSLCWRDLEVDCDAAPGRALLGMDLWSNGPVGFDFIRRCLWFPGETPGDMPLLRSGRRSLPIAWNRRGPVPFLRIIAVKPGSDMERAGCRVGDVLEAVGDLRGPALNRRNIMALVGTGKAHAWVVKREGRLVRLAYPGQPVNGSRAGAGGAP